LKAGMTGKTPVLRLKMELPRPDKSGLAMTDEDFTLTLPSPLKGEGEEEW